MADALELHVTFPDRGKAEAVARTLVDEQLAACVNVVAGVRSIYRWDGKLCEEEEVLCLVKTRKEMFDRVAARIQALHPYAVPEILAFEADDGSPAYLDWLRKSTGDAG